VCTTGIEIVSKRKREREEPVSSVDFASLLAGLKK